MRAAIVVLLLALVGCCITWRTGPHDTPVVDGHAPIDGGHE